MSFPARSQSEESEIYLSLMSVNSWIYNNIRHTEVLYYTENPHIACLKHPYQALYLYWKMKYYRNMQVTVPDPPFHALYDYFSGADYTVAGKTGTAEFNENKDSHSWFIGFSNINNPDLVV